jgi:alkanesulfonate monooxygenase SsuD/methylene tetrahydromethanopterin reductase-like flavin-dependent oxidoreductase (luciferase family)
VLAATIEASAEMTLVTTVCLPVVRRPVQSAKMLAAIDILSGGRLVAGVGPGSSPRDYAAIGVPFEERWRRFDEATRALRSLLDENVESFAGRFYSTDGLCLEPRPSGPSGPPIWIARGARRPVCAVSLASATAGSRLATTRARPHSRRVSAACTKRSRKRERVEERSQTGSPRCGSM